MKGHYIWVAVFLAVCLEGCGTRGMSVRQVPPFLQKVEEQDKKLEKEGEEVCDKTMKKITNFLDLEDWRGVCSLFSDNSLKSIGDLGGKAHYLAVLYKGNTRQIHRIEKPRITKKEGGGRVRITADALYLVQTDDREYHVVLRYVMRDDIQPDNEGVYSMLWTLGATRSWEDIDGAADLIIEYRGFYKNDGKRYKH